ncbi:MAG: hypothetical protein ABR575_07505 [Actinomycetota bacterium]
MLTPSGRLVRLVATSCVLGAVFAGSVWGSDDAFPFGPFRMYATTTTDEVTVLKFYALNDDGEELSLRAQDFGLRPAEVHGQIARFQQERATLLAHLVEARSNLDPGAPELRELRLVYGIHQLDEGAPGAYRERSWAVWSRP